MTESNTSAGSRSGPLTGFRILDLSSHIMGPYATQLLGDMGADIIVVEPLAGGKNRVMGHTGHPELSAPAMNLLRNKRSLAVDMKTSGGRAAVLALATTCDAVITNLRTGPLDRLGLSYAKVSAVAPHLVYCQAVGFNESSDRADDPAYDDIIQAECGLADAARRINGIPTLTPTILADKVCGLMVSNAVVSALLCREREEKQRGRREGQWINIAMLDVMRAFTLLEHGAGALAVPPLSAPGYTRVLSKARGPARTSDGWVNIMPYTQRDFDALFAEGGRTELVGSQLTSGVNLLVEADYLYHQLTPILSEKPTEFWVAFCKRHSIPVGRITTLEEIIDGLPILVHPRAGGYRVIPTPVSFGAFPRLDPRAAPVVGEHSAELLRESGMGAEEISRLLTDGVIRDQSVAEGRETHAGH